MSKESLKALRVFIPGLIIFLFGIPLLQGQLDFSNIFKTLSLLEGFVYVGIVVILGAIYNLTNIRGKFLKKSLESIHNNIKTRLLEPFTNDQTILQSRNKLSEGRYLIQVFYNLIDNHETLKEKAKNVHLNGLYWTTIADIRALSSIFFVIYILYWLINHLQDYLVVAVILLLIYFIASHIFAPRVTEMHIDLSNEQLEFIQVHLRKELHSFLIQVIESWG
jgi:hypothetical protein